MAFSGNKQIICKDWTKRLLPTNTGNEATYSKLKVYAATRNNEENGS